MSVKLGSIWIDNDSDLLVIVKSLEGHCDGKVKVVFNYIIRTGDKSVESASELDLFLKTKTKLVKSIEGDYSKGYEHGVQHMNMQDSIDKYLEMSDNLYFTEDEVDNIIDDAFEEGYAQAYSELQTKTERERALQEKAWDEGYDQAIDSLIEAGVIGEEDYLVEERSGEEYSDGECFSEYDFDDEEDNDEEYCFFKEIERVMNGYFPSNINVDGNNKEEMVNHPKHYNSDLSGVECIEVARYRNFNVGSALKYLWRCGLKNGNSDIQDLEKAVWYLNDEIKSLKRGR